MEINRDKGRAGVGVEGRGREEGGVNACRRTIHPTLRRDGLGGWRQPDRRDPTGRQVSSARGELHVPVTLVALPVEGLHLEGVEKGWRNGKRRENREKVEERVQP